MSSSCWATWARCDRPSDAAFMSTGRNVLFFTSITRSFHCSGGNHSAAAGGSRIAFSAPAEVIASLFPLGKTSARFFWSASV